MKEFIQEIFKSFVAGLIAIIGFLIIVGLIIGVIMLTAQYPIPMITISAISIICQIGDWVKE